MREKMTRHRLRDWIADRITLEEARALWEMRWALGAAVFVISALATWWGCELWDMLMR